MVSPATSRPPWGPLKWGYFFHFFLLPEQQMLKMFVCFPDIGNICWKCWKEVFQHFQFSTVWKNLNKRRFYDQKHVDHNLAYWGDSGNIRGHPLKRSFIRLHKAYIKAICDTLHVTLMFWKKMKQNDVIPRTKMFLSKKIVFSNFGDRIGKS